MHAAQVIRISDCRPLHKDAEVGRGHHSLRAAWDSLPPSNPRHVMSSEALTMQYSTQLGVAFPSCSCLLTPCLGTLIDRVILPQAQPDRQTAGDACHHQPISFLVNRIRHHLGLAFVLVSYVGTHSCFCLRHRLSPCSIFELLCWMVVQIIQSERTIGLTTTWAIWIQFTI